MHGRWAASAWMAALMFAVSADIRGGEPSAETGVLSMVADLIASPDRELRGLGLQQVREGLPGAEATEHLVKLLPRLAPETQAALIEALGDRGDRRARRAVLQGLSSPSAVVRLSALKALGVLGDAADVGALAQKAASGSQAEREVARQSLVRLRGDAVASSLLAELAKGGPPVRVELLRVLAARKALDAAPEAIRFAADPDPAVRLEAIRALRVLASARDTAAILGLLASAGGDKEREAARSALQAVCARGKEACVEVLAAALPTADPSTRIVLLHALGRAGGSQSLAFVVRGLADENREVRGEAIDVLSRWPDAAAIPELRRRALEASDLRAQVLAIRGLVRLVGQRAAAKPAEEDIALLGEVFHQAKRPEEKRLILATLGSLPSAATLALLVRSLDDPTVVDEAGLAAIAVAEKRRANAPAESRAALEEVVRRVKAPATRERAKQLLGDSP